MEFKQLSCLGMTLSETLCKSLYLEENNVEPDWSWHQLPKFSSSQAGTPGQDGHTEEQQGEGHQVSKQVDQIVWNSSHEYIHQSGKIPSNIPQATAPEESADKLEEQ